MRVEKETYKALIFRSLFPNKPPGMRTKHNHKRLCRISWLRFWILKKKKCRSAPWLWPFTLKVKIIVRSNYKKKAKLPDQLIKHWNPQKWSSHRASCYFLVWSPTEHHLEVITIAKPNHMYDQWLLTIDMYYTGDRLWARFLGRGAILFWNFARFTYFASLPKCADWGVPRAILSALSSTWAGRSQVWLSRKRKWEYQKSGFEKCKENTNIENWESEFETQGSARTSS